MKKYFILSIALVVIFSCSQRERPTIAFYYWKTIFKLSESEKNTLTENEVKKIYIRYFDIDLDSKNEPFPISPIGFDTKALITQLFRWCTSKIKSCCKKILMLRL